MSQQFSDRLLTAFLSEVKLYSGGHKTSERISNTDKTIKSEIKSGLTVSIKNISCLLFPNLLLHFSYFFNNVDSDFATASEQCRKIRKKRKRDVIDASHVVVGGPIELADLKCTQTGNFLHRGVGDLQRGNCVALYGKCKEVEL